jgi:hypothetical protein
MIDEDFFIILLFYKTIYKLLNLYFYNSTTIYLIYFFSYNIVKLFVFKFYFNYLCINKEMT